jgi:hypothetical protein
MHDGFLSDRKKSYPRKSETRVVLYELKEQQLLL